MSKIYITSILLFGGCVSSPQVRDELITSEQYDPDQVTQRAKELGLRPVDYLHRVNNDRLDPRYEVRIGFSDYTYSNGTWENILYTAGDFNDAYEYVVEYSSAHSDLIIYDLKTGKMFEETP